MARDVIIHYDEANGKIICSTVDHAATAPLLEKALPLETLVEALRSKGPNEAERALGAGILALLDLSSRIKIGIREYSGETVAKWESEHSAELKKKLAAGDPAAQYILAMEMITEGLRTKSKKRMDEADKLLRCAVTGGHVEAREYLADLWPTLKKRSDRSFK